VNTFVCLASFTESGHPSNSEALLTACHQDAVAEVARKSPDGLDYLINMSGADTVTRWLPCHGSTCALSHLSDCPRRHWGQRV